jgi:hypothetical protein
MHATNNTTISTLPNEVLALVLADCDRSVRQVCRQWRNAHNVARWKQAYGDAPMPTNFQQFFSRRLAPLQLSLPIGEPSQNFVRRPDLSWFRGSGLSRGSLSNRMPIPDPGETFLKISHGDPCDNRRFDLRFQLLRRDSDRDSDIVIGTRQISIPFNETDRVAYEIINHALPDAWLCVIRRQTSSNNIQFFFLDSNGRLGQSVEAPIPNLERHPITSMLMADHSNAAQPEFRFVVGAGDDSTEYAIPLLPGSPKGVDEIPSREAPQSNRRLLIALAAVVGVVAARYLFTRFSASSR